jgi:hypothetical protein
MKDMPILERRRIEAQILKHVHDVIAARSGTEEADAVIGTAVSRSAIDQGHDFATALGHTPSLQDFADIMPLWEKEDALRVEMIDASSEKLEFNIVRCRYAEMYRSLGMGDLGAVLSCNRDYSLIEGFNPEIELVREQTIMKGAPCCTFRYSRKGGA